MIKRIITAVIYLGVFIPILVFSDTFIFPVVMSLCAFIGCYEIFKCTSFEKKPLIVLPLYACSLFFPLFERYCVQHDMKFEFSRFTLGILFVIIVYTFGVAVFSHKDTSVTDTCVTLLACIYVIAAFTSVVYLRDSILHGKYIFLLPFLCAWITDSFAYFTGRFFGKHKLIPDVSPKKTVEGAVGGIVFCVITMIVFGFVIEHFFDGTASANYVILVVSGLFISIVSQIGDLIMSLIKRHYGIKDYGIMFPGHGGILDRFDSVLAAGVIIAFICTYFDLFAV